MATISSQLRLNDGMSAVLRSVTSALDTCLRSFEEMRAASGTAMDVSAITDARTELMSANNTIEQMERNSKNVENAQKGYNSALRAGSSAASDLLGKLTAMVGTYASVRQAMAFTQNNLELADNQRRQEMQLRNVAQNVGIAEDAYQSLLDTASQIQSTTMYGDEAMIGAAAELATYIQDPAALALSMQTVADYAAGMSGGAALDTTQMVDYATQLGKVYMGAYDGIKKKGFELSYAQKEVMENGTDMERALVLSDVINESWQGLAEDMAALPSGQIQQMANIWGDFREQLGNFQYPAVLQFFEIIKQNMPQIQAMVYGLANLINIVVYYAGLLLEGVANVYTFMSDNWSVIGPIIAGVAAALILLNVATAAYNTITAISNTLEAIKAARLAMTTIAEGAETTATFAATAAQHGFNAALLACPLTWIILLIIAVIVAIVAVCNWIAKTTGIAQTGFGVITGGINVAIQAVKNAGLVVANVALGIWSALGAVCSNIGIAFHNVIANVQGWFYGLLSTVLTVVSGIAAALNSLPFVSFDYSGIVAKADEYAAKSAEAYGSTEEYKSVGDAFSEGFNTFDTFTDGWAADAFQSGAAWGDGVMSGLSDTFSFDADSLMDGYNTDMSGYQPALDGIGDNTGSAAASLKNMSEDVAYMRDVAEREAINRFTTAELHVDMTGMTNRIENDMDVDGVINRFVVGVTEALDVAAEGVHQ